MGNYESHSTRIMKKVAETKVDLELTGKMIRDFKESLQEIKVPDISHLSSKKIKRVKKIPYLLFEEGTMNFSTSFKKEVAAREIFFDGIVEEWLVSREIIDYLEAPREEITNWLAFAATQKN